MRDGDGPSHESLEVVNEETHLNAPTGLYAALRSHFGGHAATPVAVCHSKACSAVTQSLSSDISAAFQATRCEIDCLSSDIRAIIDHAACAPHLPRNSSARHPKQPAVVVLVDKDEASMPRAAVINCLRKCENNCQKSTENCTGSTFVAACEICKKWNHIVMVFVSCGCTPLGRNPSLGPLDCQHCKFSEFALPAECATACKRSRKHDSAVCTENTDSTQHCSILERCLGRIHRWRISSVDVSVPACPVLQITPDSRYDHKRQRSSGFAVKSASFVDQPSVSKRARSSSGDVRFPHLHSSVDVYSDRSNFRSLSYDERCHTGLLKGSGDSMQRNNPFVRVHSAPYATDVVQKCSSCDTTSALVYDSLNGVSEFGETKPTYVACKYAANLPRSEDHHFAHYDEDLGISIFGVLDGHGSDKCSFYAAQLLPKLICKHVTKAGGVMQLKEALSKAFRECDKRFLELIAEQKKNHGLEQLLRMRGMINAGCCALVAVVKDGLLAVANAGDCRAVLGTLNGARVSTENGIVKTNTLSPKASSVAEKFSLMPPMERLTNVRSGPATPAGGFANGHLSNMQAQTLSKDHNADNISERIEVYRRCSDPAPFRRSRSDIRARVKGPRRVAGTLTVTRALGDAYLKLADLSTSPYLRYLPYITCEPEVEVHRLRQGDSFLVLASDGVWEAISSQQAVDAVITGVLQGHGMGSPFLPGMDIISGSDNVIDHRKLPGDAAERIVRASLEASAAVRGSDLAQLLSIERASRRHFHDDSTALVITFAHAASSLREFSQSSHQVTLPDLWCTQQSRSDRQIKALTTPRAPSIEAACCYQSNASSAPTAILTQRKHDHNEWVSTSRELDFTINMDSPSPSTQETTSSVNVTASPRLVLNRIRRIQDSPAMRTASLDNISHENAIDHVPALELS